MAEEAASKTSEDITPVVLNTENGISLFPLALSIVFRISAAVNWKVDSLSSPSTE